jgi:hypothetical protein
VPATDSFFVGGGRLPPTYAHVGLLVQLRMSLHRVIVSVTASEFGWRGLLTIIEGNGHCSAHCNYRGG